jgi:hypothetical protein
VLGGGLLGFYVFFLQERLNNKLKEVQSEDEIKL